LAQAVEQVGPMNLLASGMTADVGFLALGSDGMLYMSALTRTTVEIGGCKFGCEDRR
jgi:hypothetical protein